MQKDDAKLAEYIKKKKSEFAAYESANTLICAIQNWLEYMWGEEGKCGAVIKHFDRFPRINDKLTPDFLVQFRNGYYLIGEVMRTFRPESDDGKQLLAYSRCDPDNAHHDVMLILRMESDDTACSVVATMSKSSNEEERPLAPIVVLGYYKDNDTVNAEYLLLKWRNLVGNNRFSPRNVVANPNTPDLNAEICDKTHCPLRIDERVVYLKSRYPFINDDPPPIYTAVYAVWPTIASLLNEDERDEMLVHGIVEKEVSTEDILHAPNFPDTGLSANLVERAFSFLESVDLAKRMRVDNTVKYRVHFQIPPSRSELDFFADKQARSQMRLEKRVRRPHGSKRRQRHSPLQATLFDF